jgi:hypothetical protein
MTALIPYPALVRNERERFALCFTSLASSKGGQADEVKLRAYFLALADCSIVGCERAARQLIRTAGAFLPDAGTWRDLADDLGLQQYAEDLKAAQPAPRLVEQDEEARLCTARDAFIETLRRYVTPATADALAASLATKAAPTYSCTVCEDSGFVPAAPDQRDLQRVGYVADRIQRCVCAPTNPVLERQRATRGPRRRA